MSLRGGWAWALVIVLILSVCLNLFMGAAAVSALSLRAAAGGIERSGGEIAERFPPAARWRIGRELLFGNRAFRQELRALGQARREMFAAMRADPFDEAALAARMVDVRARTAAVQEMSHAAMLRAVADLPAETRRQIIVPERGARWRERIGTE